MKRYVYVLAFVVSFMSLVACSKNDPAPTSPVVGRWDLNRVDLSGFPTSTTANVNGSADFYAIYYYGSRIDIYSDNTFNQDDRFQGSVGDDTGTWAFTNNTLTLTYDAGGTDTYTYSKNKNIEELATSTPQNFTIGSSVGKAQFVYRK